jgi:hypothetical protein
MDKLVYLSNTHEGRDKFNKAIQYLLKIILSTTDNKSVIERLTPLFSKYIFMCN